MSSILGKVQQLLQARKHEEVCRTIQRATPAEMATVEYFKAAMLAMQSFCVSDQVEYAASLAQQFPVEQRKVFHLDSLVDGILRRRRFDTAARALVGFGLDNQPQYLSHFIQSLVRGGQFRLAMQWMEKLNETMLKPQAKQIVPENEWSTVFCWSPEVLVQSMISAENFEEALKYTKQHRLEDKFPPSQLVYRLLSQSKISAALRYIKEFNLETQFPMENIIEGMLAEKRWDDVNKLLASYTALQTRFPDAVKLDRMIEARDWLAVLDMLPRFQCYLDRDICLEDIPAEHHGKLRSVVQGMLDDKSFMKAMELILHFKLEEFYKPTDVIHAMISCGQYCHALKYMKLLNLQSSFDQSTLDTIEENRRNELTLFRQRMKIRHAQRQYELDASGLGESKQDLVFVKQVPISIQSLKVGLENVELDQQQTNLLLASVVSNSFVSNIDLNLIANNMNGSKGMIQDDDSDSSDDDEVILLGGAPKTPTRYDQPSQSNASRYPPQPMMSNTQSPARFQSPPPGPRFASPPPFFHPPPPPPHYGTPPGRGTFPPNSHYMQPFPFAPPRPMARGPFHSPMVAPPRGMPNRDTKDETSNVNGGQSNNSTKSQVASLAQQMKQAAKLESPVPSKGPRSTSQSAHASPPPRFTGSDFPTFDGKSTPLATEKQAPKKRNGDQAKTKEKKPTPKPAQSRNVMVPTQVLLARRKKT